MANTIAPSLDSEDRRPVRALVALICATAAIVASTFAYSPPVSAHGNAIGHFDLIASQDMENLRISVAGWALSTAHGTTTLDVRITVNGSVYGGSFPANTSRPDVGSAYPGTGNNHGFHRWVDVPVNGITATNTVCAQASIHGTWYNLIGCHTYSWNFDPMYPSTETPAACDGFSMWQGGWLACRTQDATVTYCFDQGGNPLTSKAQNGINATIHYSYNTTDLSWTKHSSCDTSGSVRTNVIYRELSSLPSGALGFAFCIKEVDSFRCLQHYAQFDKESIALAGFHATEMWKLACHETGHSMGFLHGGNSDPNVASSSPILGCMREGGYTNGSTNPWLGANNANWINWTY